MFAQDIDERCGLPASLCELQLELESSDAELNRVYKAIMSSINTGELPDAALVDANELKQSLIISQRSWLEFKKKIVMHFMYFKVEVCNAMKPDLSAKLK